jgi:hypothetical protein
VCAYKELHCIFTQKLRCRRLLITITTTITITVTTTITTTIVTTINTITTTIASATTLWY